MNVNILKCFNWRISIIRSFLLLFFIGNLVVVDAQQVDAKMPANSSAVEKTINTCSGNTTTSSPFRFLDDGLAGGNYDDNVMRQDTLAFCPPNIGQTVLTVFTEFDLEEGDTLRVFDGNISATKGGSSLLIGSGTGTGVSRAFGGWVKANNDININPSGCLTFVFTTDGDNNKGSGWEAFVDCSTSTTYSIGGQIQNVCGGTMAGINVVMTGQITATVQTDDNGVYQFNNVPIGSTVKIQPNFNENPSENVTAFDNVVISRHILGLENFTLPYQYIAADVNKSGIVTAFDIVVIRNLVLSRSNEFTNNTSWRFIDATYNLPSNPLGSNFPEEVNINNLAANTQVNFIGIKVGNVNCIAATTTDPFLNLFIESMELTEEDVQKIINVPVKVDEFNNIAGLEFGLDWDASILQYVGHNMISTIGGNMGETNIGNGKLMYVWTDETGGKQNLPSNTTLFEVQFKIMKAKSTTIKFDETTRQPLVVRDNSTNLRQNNGSRGRNNNNLVVSKPILQAGQIIINTTTIPTMSQWGLIVFSLLILNLGIFFVRQRELI